MHWKFFSDCTRLTLPRVLCCVALGLFASPSAAQDANSSIEPPPLDGRDGRELLLKNFRPKPMLKTQAEAPQMAAFPVVDVHTHFFFRTRHSREQLETFVDLMDRNRIAVCASLDGRLGERFDQHRAFLWKEHRERFVIFVNIDWQGDGQEDKPATWDCHRPDFGRRTARLLAAAKRDGASGVKIFKSFGLTYRNPDGTLVEIDDPR